MISIIIPVLGETNKFRACLTDLDKQTGHFEVIVVGIDHDTSNPFDHRVRFVSGSKGGYATQLQTGVSSAEGEILFFLDATLQLPPDALLAIERNFELLPHSIGGNFHLKFSRTSLLTKLLAAALKRQRYKGSYDFSSGIFIRRDVYEAIGGIRVDVRRPEYDFVRRMEQHGPTLYLPEAVVAPPPTFQQACKWFAAAIMLR